MRCDKVYKIIQKQGVSDGMGGYTETPVVVGQIEAFITPLSAELMLKTHGVVTTRAHRIITRDPLPERNDEESGFTLTANDQEYRILQVKDYPKVNVLTVEEVSS